MTTDELIIKLEKFNDTLPEVRDRLIMDAVFSTNAIVKRRIIGDRQSYTGTIFGIYSPKYLKQRIKKGKGSDPRINFSYTGKMLQSTQPFIVSTADDHVRVRIQPLDSQRKEVMGHHEKRFGEIIQLSEVEVDGLVTDFAAGLQDHINSSFK